MKFWVYHCFRWVCYETAAHQPETPNLYTSTPMIVMKEKIKPNQEDDSHIEKMRQKSTSLYIYIYLKSRTNDNIIWKLVGLRINIQMRSLYDNLPKS